MDEWYNSARLGQIEFAQRSIKDCGKAIDKRRQNSEQDIQQGWCGLMYACYYNQLEMVKYLFQHEYKIKTKFDTIIDAPAIEYGAQFLSPRSSNCLQLAILNDNAEVVQYLLDKIEVSGQLQQLFM